VLSTASRTSRFAALAAGAALAASGLIAMSAGAASASDSAMFSSVNASRAAHGLHAYTWNSHLASVAAGQAHRMADQHKLYHNPNLTSEVGNFRWVGENVGYGPTSDAIETAFMNSAPHRANILDGDYTEIGIASVMDDNGRLWVAQVFRQPIGGSSNSTPTVHKAAPTKPKTTTHRVSRHVTHTTSHHANATTPTPSPVATVRYTHERTHHVVRPTPQPTLAQRVSYATAQASGAPEDPIADTMAFAATMNAVAG